MKFRQFCFSSMFEDISCQDVEEMLPRNRSLIDSRNLSRILAILAIASLTGSVNSIVNNGESNQQDVIKANNDFQSKVEASNTMPGLRHSNESRGVVRPMSTVELRLGFLIGKQRLLNDRAYLAPGRQLIHVFNFAIDKINHQQQILNRISRPTRRRQSEEAQVGSDDSVKSSSSSSSNDDGGIMQSNENLQQNTRIADTNLTIGLKFIPVIGETFGNEAESIKRTIELILKHQVNAIIGPQESCELEPRLASIFNVLMISHYCSSSKWMNDGLQIDDNAILPKQQQAPSTTFVQMKPPSWKIVKHVLVVVRKLLDSYDAYSRRFVLLYYKEQANLEMEKKTKRQQQASDELQLRMSFEAPNVNASGSEGKSTRYEQSKISYGPFSRGSNDNNEKQQFKLIGELLELELSKLFNERRRPMKATNRNKPEQHSLSVLNWHTTFHYGYTKNPFRPLIRRHLLQQRLREQQQQQQQSTGTKVNQRQPTSRPVADAGQWRLGQNVTNEARKSPGVNGMSEEKKKVDAQESDAAIYLVVGHYYEHLGLMLALDELGLLEDHEQDEQHNDSEHKISSTNQWQQEATLTTISDNKRKWRRKKQRQPVVKPSSVVIGIDIEPYDERDDSVRFLRGLLMDGQKSPGRSQASVEPDDNLQHSTTNTGECFSSIASKYSHYIGIVPEKSAKTHELLDEMRQFYNGGIAGSSVKSQDTSSQQSLQLTMRLLQFARLPIEAYYLHDAIMLLSQYYLECLSHKNVSDCSDGRQAFKWFSDRQYTSSVNSNGLSKLDATARDEGSFTLVARKSVTENLAPFSLTNDDFEFDIVSIGSFHMESSESEPRLELHVSSANIDRAWLPFWCSATGGSDGSQLQQHKNRAEVCRSFDDWLSEQQNSTAGDRNDDDDGGGDNESEVKSPLSTSGHHLLLPLLLILAAAAACCPALLLLVDVLLRMITANGHGNSESTCAEELRFAEKKSTLSGCLTSYVQSAAATTFGGGNSQSLSQCWFNESDERNFLHIVHELLVSQEVNSCKHSQTLASAETPLNNFSEIADVEQAAHCSVDINNSIDPNPSLLLDETTNEGQQSCKFVLDEDVVRSIEDDNNCRRPNKQNVISLHCFMFAFPSCRFVHWLTALHQLKELVFQYQLNVVRELRADDGSNQKAASKGNDHLDFKQQSFNESCKSHSASSKQLLAAFWYISSPIRRLVSWKRHAGASHAAYDEQETSLEPSKVSGNQTRGHRLSGRWRAQFFKGQHAGTPMLKLLLNKYKTINECLYELHQLNEHPNLLRLNGLMLANCCYSAQHWSDNNKEAQLLMEHSEVRGNLSRQLRELNQNICLDSNSWNSQFKYYLWLSSIRDLLDGLRYLHHSKLGFHGNLNSQNCYFTHDWRLKLSGFHEGHLRRSLGHYEMHINMDMTLEQDKDERKLNQYLNELLYRSPEVLNKHRRVTELSLAAMQLADIYSFGLLLYELLVCEDGWICAINISEDTRQTSKVEHRWLTKANKLRIIERVKVDSSFRPPIERLDKVLSSLNRPQQQARFFRLLPTTVSSERQWQQRSHDKIANYYAIRESKTSSSNTNGNLAVAIESIRSSADSCSRSSTCRCESCSNNLRPFCLNELKSFLASCWAHAAPDRPQSVDELIFKLSPFLSAISQIKSSCHFSSIPAEVNAQSSSTSHKETSFGMNHKVNSGELSTAQIYTKLVEQAAFRRRRKLLWERKERAQLKLTLLPQILAGGLTCSKKAQQVDDVCLCQFRFQLVPMSSASERSEPNNCIEDLELILRNLNQLVSSYSGHLQLVDSQVDSLLRFLVYPQECILATKRDQSRLDHCALLASFALELTELTNRLRPQMKMFQLSAKSSLHIGTLLAGQVNSIATDSSSVGPLSLARFVLLGEALQLVDLLEQSCTQTQRILISGNFHNELEKLNRTAATGCRLLSTRTPGRTNYLSSLIILNQDVNQGCDSENQQSYVVIKRNCNNNGINGLRDTYWLLNGPKLTAGQKLTLNSLSSQYLQLSNDD